MDITIKGTVRTKEQRVTDVDLTVSVPDNFVGVWLSAITKSGRGGSSGEMSQREIINLLKGEFDVRQA